MNGPQHYAEAERLRAVAEGESWYEEGGRLVRVMALLAAAQVHATLAQAAAIVDQSNVIAVVGGRDHGYSNEWLRVLGREEGSE